jgi:hypothetical protein
VNRPFVRLVRHFFLRLFDVDLGSSEGRLGVGAVLGILNVPGALMSMVLFAKYSSLLRWIRRDFQFDPDIASLPDKYTFLAFSIAATGIIAILRLESLFPDRRDYFNLAPLPVSMRTILLAKVTALAGFVLLFVVDVNLVSSVLFPLIVMEDHGTFTEALRFIAAHAAAVTAAGIWTFCAALALTGTLMTVLPCAVFRRIRRYVQFVAVAGLLILFLSASGMRFELANVRAGNPTILEWLPPAWFLGLYQEVQGKSVGSFAALSLFGLKALLVTSVLALAAYGSSYRWFFLRSAETPEGSAAAFRVPEWLFRWLDAYALRSGFERASLRFILRTLARSDRHIGMLAAICGLGLALAVQSATNTGANEPVPLGILAAALIMVYSVLTGLRLSFGLPAELQANWILRMASDDTADPQPVVRLAMYILLLPPVVIPALVFAIAFSPVIAFWHSVFAIAASSVLVELLISGFRVIPFTCSWLPGRQNMVLAVAVWGGGVLVFGHGLAAIEAFLLLELWRFPIFLCVVAGVLYGLGYVRAVREPLAWSDTRGDLDLLRLTE